MPVSGVCTDSHGLHPSLELVYVVLWIPSPRTPQNNGLLTLRQVQTFSQTPSCGALSPFRLCSCSQPQSSPWDLTSEARVSAPSPHPPSRWADKPLGLVSAGQQRSSVQESLRFALCTPVAVLSSVAPKLPPSTTCSLRPRRGFLVCGNFSSFTAPSQRCRSHPYSFVSVFSFFFCPTQVCGDILASWEVWGLLSAFSRCSVWVVQHVDVFLMYLWRGRWSPRLTPLPAWKSSHYFLMSSFPCYSLIPGQRDRCAVIHKQHEATVLPCLEILNTFQRHIFNCVTPIWNYPP